MHKVVPQYGHGGVVEDLLLAQSAAGNVGSYTVFHQCEGEDESSNGGRG